MEDSKQLSPVGDSRAIPYELRNGLEEQQQMLNRLSRELDDYFALKVFGEMR